MMNIRYEEIGETGLARIKELCDALMAYQKSKAFLHPEFFDGMSFETRLLPSYRGATANYILAAVDGGEPVGYAYSTIAPKTVYSSGFATLKCDAFFDFDSVKTEDVGCLSQFFIKEDYRGKGIGGALFQKSTDWLRSFEAIEDHFIFVSNGNIEALRFYAKRGFAVSHEILGGFITVLRNTK